MEAFGQFRATERKDELNMPLGLLLCKTQPQDYNSTPDDEVGDGLRNTRRQESGHWEIVLLRDYAGDEAWRLLRLRHCRGLCRIAFSGFALVS